MEKFVHTTAITLFWLQVFIGVAGPLYLVYKGWLGLFGLGLWYVIWGGPLAKQYEALERGTPTVRRRLKR